MAGTLATDTMIDGISYTKGCLAHFPASAADRIISPCDRLKTLAVRISTSNDLLAGANIPPFGKSDDVWLDIGPKAWLISNGADFTRGHTTTISIDPLNIDDGACSSLASGNVQLYVGDIVKIRLEKKGISFPGLCGLGDAWDSPFGTGPNKPLNPSDILKSMKGAIQLTRQKLAVEQQAMKTANDEIRRLQAEVDRGFDLNRRAEAAKKVAETAQVDVENQLRLHPDRDCDVAIPCWHGIPPPCDRLRSECKRQNQVLADLRVKLGKAQRDVNDRLSDLQSYAVAFPTAKTDRATFVLAKTTVAVHAAPSSALMFQANYLDKSISELTTRISEIGPVIDIPLPGQWKPESITLIVNGRDYVTVNNDGFGWLKQGHSEWERKLRDGIGAGEYFVQGLRVNNFKWGCASTGGDRECGWDTFLTTPLGKDQGVSGWDEPEALGDVTVVGVLTHAPSPGGDAYVSFDLEVRTVEALGTTLDLSSEPGIRGKRYIRIEYLHPGDQRFDSDHDNWKVGDTLRVSGPVERDRDRTTFFEIHPTGSANISRIDP
jgi:hypothetical protein